AGGLMQACLVRHAALAGGPREPDRNRSALIEKELKDYINSDLKTSIKKASTTMAAKIESLQRTNNRKLKLAAELQSLGGGSIPASVKPANFGFEADLMDTVTLQDTSYDLHFDSGCTIRDAKRNLQIFYLEKQYTKKDNFVTRLLAERISIDNGWNSLDLDL
ncbi:unnamed protein product, partial [Prorocentrum cordatum]